MKHIWKIIIIVSFIGATVLFFSSRAESQIVLGVKKVEAEPELCIKKQCIKIDSAAYVAKKAVMKTKLQSDAAFTWDELEELSGILNIEAKRNGGRAVIEDVKGTIPTRELLLKILN